MNRAAVGRTYTKPQTSPHFLVVVIPKWNAGRVGGALVVFTTQCCAVAIGWERRADTSLDALAVVGARRATGAVVFGVWIARAALVDLIVAVVVDIVVADLDRVWPNVKIVIVAILARWRAITIIVDNVH